MIDKTKSKIDNLWDKAEQTGQPVDIGDTVVCDFCDGDFTESDAIGGFIFQSKACCPICEPRVRENIKGFGEERFIRAECQNFQSFPDFVRSYRGGNNFIQVLKQE